jgi:leucyl aminopeptidase
MGNIVNRILLSIFLCLSLIASKDLTASQIHPVKKPTKVKFSTDLPSDGNLVLGIYQGEDGQVAKSLNQYGQVIEIESSGGLSHAISVSGFDAKAESIKLIPAPKGSKYQQILLVGLGKKSDKKSELDWQKIGGQASQIAIQEFKSEPVMAIDANVEQAIQFGYGAKLGSYYFDQYFTDEKKQKQQNSLTIINPFANLAAMTYQANHDPVANAIWHTRNLSNEPSNKIYPQSFVEHWKGYFKGIKKVKFRVLDEKDMLKKGMGAIYGVGRGSKRPPRMMIVEYMGGNKGDAPIVIVGKGITFDSGGISIKGSKNMWNMKFDMSGAAASIGVVHALAGRKAKVNVVGIAALAENMPDGNAQRPGDVVTSMSGKTIQIRSTDAEGRLVLADGMFYGDTKYDPALIVDLATLTGSAMRALGKDYAALFTRHDDLVAPFIEAGKKSGDQVWQLPLNKSHFKAIENKVADVMNSGPTAPGASAGAAFVGTFVRETTPWVHLDIASVAWGDHTTPLKSSPGSPGFGVALLNAYIKQHFEK